MIQIRSLRWGVWLLAMSVGCGDGTSPEPSQARPSAGPRPVEWAPRIEPLPLPVSDSAGEPQLTSSARGVIVSWLDHHEQGVTLRFAERTNGNWSEPRRVAASEDWFVSWADVPSVLRMSDGTLVANWYPATDPLIEAYDLRVSYSRDDGRTWARAITPHHDGTKTQHGFVTMFEQPGGGLGLVWLDGRDQELNKTDEDGGAMALYYASFDAQWKQRAEAVANARVCECCSTSVAITPDGMLAAFRDRSAKEIRDIYVTRLENGAWTEARPVHADDWQIDSCPVNGPMLSARGRQVAVVWFTAKNDKAQAFVAFSSDAGRTWGEPIRLDDESSLGHVDVELLDDGSAVATWVEFADGSARFKVRKVEPTGGRSAAIDVAGEKGGRVTGYPRLARFGNELVFAWIESGDAGPALRGASMRLP
jgi:hypothetical protein